MMREAACRIRGTHGFSHENTRFQFCFIGQGGFEAKTLMRLAPEMLGADRGARSVMRQSHCS
jgi:hypothetical protein